MFISTNRASLLGVLITTLVTAASSAHPLSQGTLNITVHPDRVSVRARVTIEEVLITSLMTRPDATHAAAKRSIDETYAEHAKYIADHIHIAADGQPLIPTVKKFAAPQSQPSASPDKTHVEYDIDYIAETFRQPAKLDIHHDVLVKEEFAPGVKWEASYAIRIGVEGGPITEGLLLTSLQPVTYACDWNSPPPSPTGAPAIHVNRGQLFRDYLSHGVHHILTGYDHLLFISALVLAATGVWDLVKVVTAFTVAHTITLTLAALKLVSLPEGIVEPMIAASIVFVALQNVLWPKQARGWGRLAIAFGFGLFHGLGFAGGLLEAMQEMSGLTIALAIVAFSIGVEIGHQLIVLPLFGALKLARQTKRSTAQRDRISWQAMRYGSVVIGVAGAYYLIAAVSSALSVGSAS